MKCSDCGATMKVERINRKYDESGLPGVTLEGVEVRRCPKCGEEDLIIEDIEGLHRLLARMVISKPSRLNGTHVRFLRTWLGYTAADFAPIMGVGASTLSRWENDKEPIGPQADRLLRMIVASRKPVQEYEAGELAKIEGVSKPLRARVRRGKREWQPSEASP